MKPTQIRKALQRLNKCELKVVLELVNCLKRKQDAQAKKAAKRGKS